MGFMDDVNKEAEKYGGGVDKNRFEFDKPGIYQIRILVKPKVLATHFFGKGNPSFTCVGIDEGCKFHSEKDGKASIKLVTYVLDRRDGNIKIAELPLSISYSINDLQEDSDFAFSQFPMPYDVKVKYDPDNSDPKAKYRLQPSTKIEPITAEENALLEERMSKRTPETYVQGKKDRVLQKNAEPVRSNVDYPKEEINPDDIPF